MSDQHEVKPLDGGWEGRWRCSCGRAFKSASGFVMCPDDPRQSHPHRLIGHDSALIQGLARSVEASTRRHATTRLHETPDGRGYWFEANLVDADGMPTTRVARITIELDRVFRYCATHRRQHDEDGDTTCRWEG